ncbi:glycosyltransferase [Antribacter gilvus]|uniref:glycosyltransferase n=1 Tax=Antribacter gilvus TaxID=2304675 RepID=UPI000F78A633|nr:glycosyltransferase [Antribacter gilvus]
MKSKPFGFDKVLRQDPRAEDGPRLLILLARYDEGVAEGGAELRQAGLVSALRRLFPADVLSIADLRELKGCGNRCVQSGTDPCNPERPWPYCGIAEVALGQLLDGSKYAAVMLSHVPTHQYIRAVREHSDAPLLIDFHNAEADLEQEIMAHPDYSLLRADDADEWTGMEGVERFMVESADAVTVPSAVDLQRFIRRYGERRVEVVPNAVVVPASMPQEHHFTPSSCFFLGVLDYFPNTRAALEIIEGIGPAIAEEFPSMRVQVAGRRPPEQLTKAASVSPVELIANVADARPLFKDSVLLVPLDCGGGTRLKVLEAFAAGCPVISTAKGMEGIAADPGVHYLEAEDIDSYVSALRQIIAEPSEDLRRRRNAFGLVRSTYSWEALVGPLSQVLASVSIDA